MKKENVISAGDFKAHCLALMDTVKNKRQTIVITKRGIPVAKLMPTDDVSPSIFGWMRDTVVEQGNIIEPVECTWGIDHE